RKDGLGPAPYPKQPYFAQMPRLLIYETMVHHIDTARYLFGEVAGIYAQCRSVNPGIAGEDQALLTMTHTSGLQGVIDGHRFSDSEPDGPVMGEACFEGDAGVLRLLGTGEILIGSKTVWNWPSAEGYRGDSVRATQQHFIECLQSGAPFESGAREYLKTVGAVEAAYRSIAERRMIPLAAQ
ncbi:MAG: Gfo/Idh/MocA family protein, partial [Bryobacteraceae bacterium]